MNQQDFSIAVYRHAKRPEWGLALLIWERGDKRGYLFEDGAQRVFAKGFQHLLAPHTVDQHALSHNFRRQISQMRLESEDGFFQKAAGCAAFTIAEQAQLLEGQFAGGFLGDDFRRHHRGEAVKKRLKRHRAAAVTEALEVLAAGRVAAAVTEHRHEELWRAICKLLRGTDLVPLRDVKAFELRLPWVTRDLTIALAALLHAEAGEPEIAYEQRFSTFVSELARVLGSSPSWQLVTSFGALFTPRQQVCVHPASFRQQSKWLGGKPLSSNKPNFLDYSRALDVATTLSSRLEQLGVAPQDLLDVHDFIRLTTTPSAKKRLAALRQSDLSDAGLAGAAPAGQAGSSPHAGAPDGTRRSNSTQQPNRTQQEAA